MQQIIVIEPIVTDRLILKALVKEDASAILHILSDRETAWWSDDFKMRSLDEAIDFIDWGNEAIDVIHYGLFRKESEKAIVNIETIKKTNADLIETLDKVIEIHKNGRIKRQEAEKELETIEKELKDKMLEIHIEK